MRWCAQWWRAERRRPRRRQRRSWSIWRRRWGAETVTRSEAGKEPPDIFFCLRLLLLVVGKHVLAELPATAPEGHRSEFSGLRPDVHPRVDVGAAPEVPDHRRALELPHIPHTVIADVQVPVEGHGERLAAAAGLDVAHRFVAVLFPEREQQVREHLLDEFPLVALHVRNRESRLLAPPPQLDRGVLLLLTRVAEKRGSTLFPIEGLDNLVRAQCLEPVDVARVVGPLVEALGGMSVKNRAAERGAFDRVAVAPCGAVPARQDELELSAARLAEDRDGV